MNTPAGDMPPAEIAREAQAMAKQVGLTCKIWTEDAARAEGGFGGILGVGQGQREPAAHDRAHVHAARARPTPIALTGKGIAFDSGGLSIKDAEGHGDDEGRHGRRRRRSSPR